MVRRAGEVNNTATTGWAAAASVRLDAQLLITLLVHLSTCIALWAMSRHIICLHKDSSGAAQAAERELPWLLIVTSILL